MGNLRKHGITHNPFMEQALQYRNPPRDLEYLLSEEGPAAGGWKRKILMEKAPASSLWACLALFREVLGAALLAPDKDQDAFANELGFVSAGHLPHFQAQ